MIGRHHEHQFVVAKRNGDDLAALGRIGDDAEVDFALDEVFVNFVGAQIFEMNIDRRIVAQEFRQIRRQLVQTDAVNGADANRAGDHRADFAQAIFQLEEFADDFLARGVENLAGGGRFDSRSVRVLSIGSRTFLRGCGPAG